MRVTMDAQGRLLIPASIRDEAGLEADVPLEIRVRNGKVEIETVEDTSENVGRAAAATAVGRTTGRTTPSGLSLVRGGNRSTERTPIERPQLDLLIRMAIAHRRLVELVYAGRKKLVEPHDYGMRNKEAQLLCHQVSGESQSNQPTGWRSLKVSSISDFRVLEATFPGRRPADTHIQWDQLFIRVEE